MNHDGSGVSDVAGIAVGGGYAYLSTSTEVDECVVNSDGSLGGCTSTGSGFALSAFVTLYGGYAYVGNRDASFVTVCAIGSGGGALTGCADSTVGTIPDSVTVFGDYAYVGDLSGNIYLCTVRGGGLTDCEVSDGGASFAIPQQLAIH